MASGRVHAVLLTQVVGVGRRNMPLLTLLFLISSLLLFFALLVSSIRMQQKQQEPTKGKNAENVMPDTEEAVPAVADFVCISERSLVAARIVQQVRIRNAQLTRTKLSSFDSQIREWMVRRKEEGYTPMRRLRLKIARSPRLSSIAEEVCPPAHAHIT